MWRPLLRQNYFFPMTSRPACKHCAEPEGVQLTVDPDGYSVTSGYQHKPECPALRCPHGVLWTEDCATCDADRAERNAEEDDDGREAQDSTPSLGPYTGPERRRWDR